jgi:exodeoxyribonuclease VII small subunit
MAKQKFNFEKSINRIKEISERMQEDSISLEESLKLFEEGSELIESCQTYLEKAELKVRKIIDKNVSDADETFE